VNVATEMGLHQGMGIVKYPDLGQFPVHDPEQMHPFFFKWIARPHRTTNRTAKHSNEIGTAEK
jgi:hypothetical protein